MASLDKIQILDPAGEVPSAKAALAPRVQGIAGTSVGFRVQWPSFDIFMERVEELLKERHGVRNVQTMYTGSDGTAAGKVTIRGRSDAVSWNKAYDDFARKIEWGIFGLAA